jgi:hypothetical protein
MLLQRGNGARGESGALRVSFPDAKAFFASGGRESKSTYTPFAIGWENGTLLGFTEVVALADGTFLALASAEDSRSTYADGEVAGSALFHLCFDDMAPVLRKIASFVEKKKFEGLAIEAIEGSLRLWLVDDADDPKRASALYTAVLGKNQAPGLQFLPR